MVTQGEATFGQALKTALREARWSQAKLADKLGIDPGQVSRWATDKAVPHIETVAQIEELLSTDLHDSFTRSTPEYELYVSAPITGLGPSAMAAHHDDVAHVVSSLERHVNSWYWPGEDITSDDKLLAPDLATETNMKLIIHCSAFLYVQFAEIVRPSSALIELGIALGRRMKTTMILQTGLSQAFMLDGFSAVAERLPFLPQARIYYVRSPNEAASLIQRNGRHLLGLS